MLSLFICGNIAANYNRTHREGSKNFDFGVIFSRLRGFHKTIFCSHLKAPGEAIAEQSAFRKQHKYHTMMLPEIYKKMWIPPKLR
ncbi:hypothetical protein L873DRAFT_1813085 [Choiromyces venosus 120613-1]|uniref:Uncharacterized protein n=1 Tax=Choiromyces venosus 120613-1 TaxID=1336337 RepID=A0A3N4JF89_9PEZI|nr:hypothetical protein L873DRAFT_1813085 [Choiromyces venosus 120613-1]